MHRCESSLMCIYLSLFFFSVVYKSLSHCCFKFEFCSIIIIKKKCYMKDATTTDLRNICLNTTCIFNITLNRWVTFIDISKIKIYMYFFSNKNVISQILLWSQFFSLGFNKVSSTHYIYCSVQLTLLRLNIHTCYTCKHIGKQSVSNIKTPNKQYTTQLITQLNNNNFQWNTIKIPQFQIDLIVFSRKTQFFE